VNDQDQKNNTEGQAIGNDMDSVYVKEVDADDMGRHGVQVGEVEFRRTSKHGSTPYRVYYGAHQFVLSPNVTKGGWDLTEKAKGYSLVWHGRKRTSSRAPFSLVATWILDTYGPPEDEEGES